MAVNKVVYGTTVLVDLTADTVTAATLMQGYTAHDKSGALITGTATGGGGGDTYTLTTIVPEQTFTAQEATNDSYQAVVTYTAGLEDGESYLVTFDGEQYACECGVLWGSDYMAGMIGTFWGDRGDNPFPFGLDYVPSENVFVVGSYDLNQHTIKVEHLEFVDGPLTIIPKSITANGTYNASSDNADGYSSVTVNVSGGGSPTLQSKTVTPTTSQQTVQPDSGYDGLSQVTVNAIPSEYIVPSGSQTITSNGTVNVTALAEVVVNVAGSSAQTATGTFTGNGTRTIDIACNFEPDIVYFTSNPGTTASSGTVAAIIVRDLMTATRYRNNSTTNSSYVAPGIVGMNTSGSSYSWRATYANSTVTLYCFSNSTRALLTSGRTYTYTFIKWT